jgi:hypothetical protein
MAPCEACRYDAGDEPEVTILVEGRLRLDADVGFTSCWRRGHRIRLRRVARAPLTAA